MVDKEHTRPRSNGGLKGLQAGVHTKGYFSYFGAIVICLEAVQGRIH
jgi:hypothetical protein